MWEVEWYDNNSNRLRTDGQESILQLDRLLDELHDQCGKGGTSGAQIVAGVTRNILAIGIGAERAVLSFSGPDGLQPYYLSRGESQSKRGITFLMFGQASEFCLKNVIPLNVARQAMRDFALTGERPNRVEWEDF